MTLPSPTFAFTIPSVHDATRLECRIYLPRDIQRFDRASSWKKQGAILAHPYAPLGGCYDDPVVGFVGEELLKAGFIVGTFNFRGAGGSEGHTSWTARPELGDYVSFYGFMLRYLHGLKVGQGATQESGRGGLDPTPVDDTSKANPDDPSGGIHILLGGYSYGSLVASHLPTVDVIVQLFSAAPAGTPIREICNTADKISARSTETLDPPVLSSMRDDPSLTHDETGLTKISKPDISYLLVSPLLPPISLFLTVFCKLSLDVGVETSAQGKPIPCPKPADQLRTHRSLAIFGNQDAFTSASKLQKWSDELAHVSGSIFQSREITGAGHFWRERGVEARAREALSEWLRQMA